MSEFTVIIPARYASTRLPGKPLLDIAGKPMIAHVFQQAQKSAARRIIVATDDRVIKEAAQQYGAEVCLTSTEHTSGTERLAEVIDKMDIDPNEAIVNVQGDEPLIPPVIINQVADNLLTYQASMASLAAPLMDIEELFDPNIVKVVTDSQGYVLYFSRAVIPWDRAAFTAKTQNSSEFKQLPLPTNGYLRHIGIYAYRASFIQRYVQWQPSTLEKIEALEQLRVLWYGEKIHVALAKKIPAIGIDTPHDLEKIRTLLTA